MSSLNSRGANRGSAGRRSGIQLQGQMGGGARAAEPSPVGPQGQHALRLSNGAHTGGAVVRVLFLFGRVDGEQGVHQHAVCKCEYVALGCCQTYPAEPDGMSMSRMSRTMAVEARVYRLRRHGAPPLLSGSSGGCWRWQREVCWRRNIVGEVTVAACGAGHAGMYESPAALCRIACRRACCCTA
eukprot:685660-Pleurochrysis_carterae.AAC.1